MQRSTLLANKITNMKTPKYPRVMVSGKRHNSLAAEAARTGKSIAQVAEAKFVKAGKK